MDIKSFNIKDFIDGYGSDITEQRESRRKDTNEVFTPFEIIEDMCSKIPEEDWADPEKTFLEPSFGNGNIVLYIIWKRLAAGIDWETAVNTLYGTELMEDNCFECKSRIMHLFDNLGIDYDEDLLMDDMDKQLVNTDFFNWDFENWKPINKTESKSISLF